MSSNSSHDLILAAVPHLRAFAISLTGDVVRADDLVQETLLRALTSIDRFEPGTNMRAWLFTILRNLFHTEHRKRRREVEDVDGAISGRVAVLPDQEFRLDMGDLQTALAQLSAQQREALLLIAAQGMSYEETAVICGTNVGTIKSRVNRARTRLAELLFIGEGEDLGPDRRLRAVLAQPVAQQSAA
jgi:RNA polymerase sigma-70 factor (ECF subfamily)